MHTLLVSVVAASVALVRVAAAGYASSPPVYPSRESSSFPVTVVARDRVHC